MAFDASINLYSLSSGSSQTTVETFLASFTPGQGPVRTFHPTLASGGSLASQLAVTQ